MKRGFLLWLACAGALGLGLSASASAADPASGTPLLRTAATKLITAELNGDGATACSVLYAPLTGTVSGRTCVQRWDARSAHIMASTAGARRLRADLRAVATAPVTLNGLYGSIDLPHPLLGGHSLFYWTANCWMLED
jgi:hypothetical protein